VEQQSNYQSHNSHIKDEAYRLLVEAAQEYAIFLMDPEGNILTWNRGAERLKGYAPSEIIGKNFRIFYTQEDLLRNHPAEELKIARETGSYEEEGWRIRKDGRRFWASIFISKLVDEAGNFIGFSKITRDFDRKKKCAGKTKRK
jgi:PAS domain S-box-containing protein